MAERFAQAQVMTSPMTMDRRRTICRSSDCRYHQDGSGSLTDGEIEPAIRRVTPSASCSNLALGPVQRHPSEVSTPLLLRVDVGDQLPELGTATPSSSATPPPAPGVI